MTNTQLKVILATARLGSISAAAKELGLSQPNASNYIKAVEDEVGFSIFIRTNTGITPSPKGSILIEETKKILDASNTILSINEMSHPCRLRLGISAFYIAREAFVKFCDCYGNQKNVDFQCQLVAFEQGIKQLANLSLDLVVVLSFDEDDLLIKRLCDEYHLKKIFLKSLPTAINVRKDHPLLKECSSINMIADSDLLKQYPHVCYKQFIRSEDISHTYKSYVVPSSGMIVVEDMHTRLSLLKNTDYFTAGIRHTQETLDKYGLTAIPIEHFTFNVNCYFREGDEKKEEITKYLEIFKKQLELI